MNQSIIERYESLVRDQQLEADPEQRRIVGKLDALANAISTAQLASKSSSLGWLFGRTVPLEPVKGLYIWGKVGRGKTMLMDLFFETVSHKRKRRAHFHAFMSDVHERIHGWRQRAKRGEVTGSDPIAPVARALASEAGLLCFDEFSVTDIADAMLLGRLFEAMFAQGVIVVATSNVEPENLYRDGLNRALFLPFIALIGARMESLCLEARADYRLEKLGGASVYHTPLGGGAHQALTKIFGTLTANAPVKPVSLSVKGRKNLVPIAAQGVAWVQFADLCEVALGAADFLSLAQNFHTIIIENVPALTQETRNSAKRFITLIDILYDNAVKTVISAAVPVNELYQGEQGSEVFEFDRTVSRLIEMRSVDYLGLAHGRKDKTASGDTTGLVET